MNRLQDRELDLFIPLLLLGATALSFCWALIIPFGQAPDEVLRYDIVRFIADTGELPVAGDPRLMYGSVDGATYASLPFFPYLLASLFVSAVRLLHLPVQEYLAARMLSVLSGTAAVWFVSQIALRLFPDRARRRFLPVVFAFIPQFTFLCAYVNQDSFTVMLCAASMLLWLKGLDDGWQTRTVLLTGLVTGLILLSYLNGYGIALVTLIVYLASSRRLTREQALRKLLLAVCVIFLVAGWQFIRNAVVYHGDWTGFAVNTAIREEKAIDGMKPSQTSPALYLKDGLFGLFFETDYLILTFISFWGAFGWMDVLLPRWYYVIAAGLCTAVLAGILCWLVQKIRHRTLRRSISNAYLWGLILGCLITGALHLYFSYCSAYQPQGRYLYPALPAICILAVCALDSLPLRRLHPQLMALTGAFFVCFDLWAGYAVLYREYFP